MAADPPKSFSRPVDLPDGRRDARFRTVTVRGDVFPGGRVYFCEHGTPDLVWRPEWQKHGNGARETREFVVASEEFEREANAMAQLVGGPVEGRGENLSVAIVGAAISFLSPSAYRTRYGALASDLSGRASIFGAIVIGVDNLSNVREMASAMDLSVNAESDRVVIRQPEFDCVLEFVA